MEEKIKISLKTAIIIASVIIVLFIVSIVSFCQYIKNNQSSSNEVSKETSQESYKEEKQEEKIVESSDSDYIYNHEIQSIVIKYYEGYNIATGDAISDTIPLNTIELKDKDLTEMSNLIKTLTKVKISKNSEEYGHMQYDHICDYYKIEINDDVILLIGDEYGILEQNSAYFKVPEDLFNKVLEIVKKYNEENVYKSISSEKVTIISDNEKLEVTDAEQLKEISSCQYYAIIASNEEFKDEKVAYTLDLNSGTKIDVYFASVLSCIYYPDGSHEYIYTGNLEDVVKKIFENSKVKMNTGNVEKIKVTYKNKEYIIDDENKIAEILKDFKNLEYRDYNYLESMSESDFDDNDIKIYVNNSKYIISGGNIGYASRFYIDEDGKLYDIAGLGDNGLEKYFKELVNYDE